MGVFTLLTTAPFLNDAAVYQSVHAVTHLLQRQLIVTDSLTTIQNGQVDLLFWLPGRFDEAIYQHLHCICPRIVFLAHVSTGDPQQRMRAPRDVLARPGLLTLVVPFDVEEVHFILTHAYSWKKP